MTTVPVTIDLPKETYQRAKRFARLINRDLLAVLAETVASSLPPLRDEADLLPSVTEMSDGAVLDLANSNRINGVDPITGKTISLYHPCQQKWSEHFTWSDDGTHIVGLTPCGRKTVVMLKLNIPLLSQ